MSKQHIGSIIGIIVSFLCLTAVVTSLILHLVANKHYQQELQKKDEQIAELNEQVFNLSCLKVRETNQLQDEADELFVENLTLMVEIEDLRDEIQEYKNGEATPVVLSETNEYALKPKKEVVVIEEIVVEEKVEEPTTEESTTEEPETDTDDGLQYSSAYNVTDNHLTKSNGSIHYNGHRETWYSTNEAAGATTAVSIPGKHVADDGTIRDADGYVCVASSDHSFYEVVETSVGPGKVYDTGCSHGTIDVYTTW